jgi:hypothetical protein
VPSKIGVVLADARWGKNKLLSDKVKETAIPLIIRNKLIHSDIVRELRIKEVFKYLSDTVMKREVGVQCYAMGRKDRIKGLRKSS